MDQQVMKVNNDILSNVIEYVGTYNNKFPRSNYNEFCALVPILNKLIEYGMIN